MVSGHILARKYRSLPSQTQPAECILLEGSRTSHSFERSGYAGSIQRRRKRGRTRPDPLSDAQGRIRRNKKVLRSARFRLPFLPSTDTAAHSNRFPGYRLNGYSPATYRPLSQKLQLKRRKFANSLSVRRLYGKPSSPER
jgi:hypothetical protein